MTTMTFPGFDAQDFELFSIPDFGGRMTEIRGHLKPKLIALGEDLNAAIEEMLGLPTFPHVAQHMRRRVNPPPETWVAFCRDRRGYKRWTHYRIAVSAGGVRVTVFVEDDADDKARLGERLERNATKLLSSLGSAPVQWYTLAEAPLPHADLTQKRLKEAGSALQRLKTAKFQAGVALPPDEARMMKPDGFEAWALEQVRVLKPLYLAGAVET